MSFFVISLCFSNCFYSLLYFVLVFLMVLFMCIFGGSALGCSVVFTVDFRIRELYMFFKRLASVSERLGELREHSFFAALAALSCVLDYVCGVAIDGSD